MLVFDKIKMFENDIGKNIIIAMRVNTSNPFKKPIAH